ncbi:hypothetical protein J6590_010265 [Homalodisca vitripennis]|nr:hypothetical protein J6590_010265 [Homalodisca vitripennis]
MRSAMKNHLDNEKKNPVKRGDNPLKTAAVPSMRVLIEKLNMISKQQYPHIDFGHNIIRKQQYPYIDFGHNIISKQHYPYIDFGHNIISKQQYPHIDFGHNIISKNVKEEGS